MINSVSRIISLIFFMIPVSLIAQPALVWLERNGEVVIEAESVEIPNPWKTETRIDGYSGSGFITWTGENVFETSEANTITYPFYVLNPGVYYLQIRNYHDNPDRTESNDVFVKINDGNWIKTYSHEINHWTWFTGFDINHNWGYLPKAELVEGINYLRISGRSKGFSIDKFVFVVAEKLSSESWQEYPESERVPKEKLTK